jgi:3-keto-5-aminohexanoate cleavage enzyme
MQVLGRGVAVQVGMEDSVHYWRGQRIESNRQAVESRVRIGCDINRDIATRAQAQETLGL